MIDRRNLLLATLAATLAPRLAAAQQGPSSRFGFDDLKALARSLRAKPYAAPKSAGAELLDRIDYSEHDAITPAMDHALFKDGRFPASFFPLGRFFRKPVRIFALEDGSAREVAYLPELFNIPAGNLIATLPRDAGFAGLRLHDAKDGLGDWAAFLGASYFRASGDERQYGISARGVAIDTDAPVAGGQEEFPDFTRLYVAPERDGAIEILALLEGPSLTGAYRFSIRREPKVTFAVDSVLYPRRAIRRIGIAPGTSMYHRSETIRWRDPGDWRPEVHDSDGLLILNGDGSRTWRALNAPPRFRVSEFPLTSPKGFGLMQRDRAHASYVDRVLYERRPSLWVEPKGDWGRGSVTLVEIPTADEYHDNIVSFWTPAEPVPAGGEHAASYVLHFCADEPVERPLARCTATRITKMWPTDKAEQIPGQPDSHRDFAIAFKGDGLVRDGKPAVMVDVTVSRGIAHMIKLEPSPDGSGDLLVLFRMIARGEEPIAMSIQLKSGGRPASETWTYEYFPEWFA